MIPEFDIHPLVHPVWWQQRARRYKPQINHCFTFLFWLEENLTDKMYIFFLLFVVSESRSVYENLENMDILENVDILEGMNEEPVSLGRTKRFNSRFLTNQLGMDQWVNHDSYRHIRSDMFQNKRKNFNKTVKVRVTTEELLAAKLKEQILKLGRKRLMKNKRNISGLKINVSRPSRIWDISQKCY